MRNACLLLLVFSACQPMWGEGTNETGCGGKGPAEGGDGACNGGDDVACGTGGGAGSSERYLVGYPQAAWIGDRYVVTTVTIAGDDSWLDIYTVLPDGTVAQVPVGAAADIDPAASLAGGTEGGLLVWVRDQDGVLVGQRLGVDGGLVGEPIIIANTLAMASVVFDGAQWIVAWDDEGARAAHISPDGTLLDPVGGQEIAPAAGPATEPEQLDVGWGTEEITASGPAGTIIVTSSGDVSARLVSTDGSELPAFTIAEGDDSPGATSCAVGRSRAGLFNVLPVALAIVCLRRRRRGRPS